MITVYSMTAFMDLSFPGQLTATATKCVSLTIVYTCWDHVLESLILDSK